MLQPPPIAPSSDDKRWNLVQATMRRNGFRSDAVIEVLHSVQELFGYLDRQALLFVSRSLNVAPSQVYGVATFYHYFNLNPHGEHVCSICTGTACHIKGADQLLAHMADSHGLRPGETSPDGDLTLLTVRCIGSCGLAPAVVFDDEVTGNVEISVLESRIQGFGAHDHD